MVADHSSIFSDESHRRFFLLGKVDSYRLVRWYPPLGQFPTQWNCPPPYPIDSYRLVDAYELVDANGLVFIA